MLQVEVGDSRGRPEMEKWFERAMRASGSNKSACNLKMDWLDPKWHGTREELLAFGRACRDTKNWRAGITLLLADAHRRASERLSREDRAKYFRSGDVWNDIKTPYEEYLAHFPTDYVERSRYAAYCYMCGKCSEADEQFRAIGDNLVSFHYFPMTWLKEIRASAAAKSGRATDKPSK